MDNFELDELLLSALREDIGAGDITTNVCIPEHSESKGYFIAKEPGVICGIGVMSRVFTLLDSAVCVLPLAADGDTVSAGDKLAEISGPSRSILTGERVALNLIQRLSGIATRTAAAVKEVSATKAKITDTRKTTPGLRALEKYAVRTGGGVSHRFGLFDGVLIKDNHIAAAGGIRAAVSNARKHSPHTLKIEVETESPEQAAEALSAGADIIMLDNMGIEEMKKAVELVSGRALTEASGNMGERSLSDVAGAGVDIISVGALTHTVKAMDISLRFYGF